MKRSLLTNSHLAIFAIMLLPAAGGLSAATNPPAQASLSEEISESCHFNMDTSHECTTTYKYKILKPIGKDLISRIDYTYPDNEQLNLIDAKWTAPGKGPVALKDSQIHISHQPNHELGLTNEKQLSLVFPKLTVGTIVSYSIKTKRPAKNKISEIHYTLDFPPSTARRDKFEAKYTSERPIYWESEFAENFSVTPSNMGRSLEINLKTPIHSSEATTGENYYIRNSPRIEISSSKEKQNHLGEIAAAYNQIMNMKLPPEASKIVESSQKMSNPEKISKYMQHIIKNYRYLGDWRESGRGYIPAPIKVTEDNGYGDCKDLSVLLGAMLISSRIPAEIAWTTRGDEYRSLLIPGIFAPTHAIIRANVDGETWWIDPTNNFFIPGKHMSDIQDRWALVADKTGVIHEYKIPLQELEESIALDAEAHYVNESSAQVSIQMLLSPTVASEILISDLNFGRDNTNKDICSVFGKKISNCTVSRDAVEDIILSKYKINVKLENLNPLNKMGDGKFYLVEPFVEVWEEITNYLQNSDNGDLLTSGPETLNYNFTFSGGNIEKTIKPCTVTSQWYDISITENLKPDKISYNFILSKKQKWIPHEEANSAPFKLMLDAVDSCTRQLKKEIKF